MLNSLLRNRYLRLALQAASFVVLLAVVLDGLFGPSRPSQNLAGTFLWAVARPINVLFLVLVGNLFCLSCPFTFLREVARFLKIPKGKLEWPTWMRSKWIAAGAFAVYFGCFQWLHLWTDPRKTACILLAYVGFASLLNTLFRTAVFCKYICPMGQFNFITSMLAPLEVRVKQTSICATCETQACIRGSEVQAGCEMQLFLPKKVGNLDCTFCTNCIKACPNENVHVAFHRPVRNLIEDPARASFQRLSRRPDFAMLVLIGIAASIAVAAAATSAGQAALRGLAQHEILLGSAAIAVLICGGALIAWTEASERIRRFWRGSNGGAIFSRFTLALLPIGTAMWVAQLVIPFPAAAATTFPVFKGISAIVSPVKLVAAPLVLSAGLLTSLYAGVKILRRLSLSKIRTVSGAAAWSLGSSSLYLVYIWILGQPRA